MLLTKQCYKLTVTLLSVHVLYLICLYMGAKWAYIPTRAKTCKTQLLIAVSNVFPCEILIVDHVFK